MHKFTANDDLVEKLGYAIAAMGREALFLFAVKKALPRLTKIEGTWGNAVYVRLVAEAVGSWAEGGAARNREIAEVLSV